MGPGGPSHREPVGTDLGAVERGDGPVGGHARDRRRHDRGGRAAGGRGPASMIRRNQHPRPTKRRRPPPLPQPISTHSNTPAKRAVRTLGHRVDDRRWPFAPCSISCFHPRVRRPPNPPPSQHWSSPDSSQVSTPAAAEPLDRVGRVPISPHIRRLRERVGHESSCSSRLLPSSPVTSGSHPPRPCDRHRNVGAHRRVAGTGRVRHRRAPGARPRRKPASPLFSVPTPPSSAAPSTGWCTPTVMRRPTSRPSSRRGCCREHLGPTVTRPPRSAGGRPTIFRLVR